MIIKKIISTVLCMLILLSSTTLPISAAWNGCCSNAQINNQVQLFNKTKLKKLNWYILCGSFDHFITKDLITVYKKLIDLEVSDISVANELNKTANGGNSNSIGSQLDNIFSFMDIVSEKYYTNQFEKTDLRDSRCYFIANLNTKIRNLIARIDQVSNL